MGMIVDKASINGIFGGITNAKTGKTYLAIVSPGPKIDKFAFANAQSIVGSAAFGDLVTVELLKIEQKFSDFNGSFSESQAAKITVAQK